jgi:perosamine synthetase
MSFSDYSRLKHRIAEAIRSVIGQGNAQLHTPKFGGNEWIYLKECLDSTYVSSVGSYVTKFEECLADYTGAQFAVATVSGTAALHVALLSAGVKSGDEVLIPSLTFVATANAVSYINAVPHFMEVEQDSFGVDCKLLEQYLEKNTFIQNGECINKHTNKVIRALIAMHVFGRMGDVDRIVEIAEKFKLILIEDAAESLGSTYKNQHAGTFGKLGILSFNGNKIITTGGGGAVLTDDEELAQKVRHMSTTAKLPHRWAYIHDQVGYNYRMPNINAALGCAQLEQIDFFISEKKRLFVAYKNALKNIPELCLLEDSQDCISNHWLQALMLKEEVAHLRDDLLDLLNSQGIGSRPIWTLMHKLEPFKNCPKMDLKISESIEGRCINIPSGVGII